MTLRRARRLLLVMLMTAMTGSVIAQGNTRRLTTIDALRQFPGYYHLQNVMLRGELVESGTRFVLRADDREIRAFLKDQSAPSGPVDVRGQLVDVGRLEPTDPRVAPFAEGRDAEQWPKPGQELILNVTSVADAPLAATATVRALALEPWKFEGQAVTVTGNFRGRNLFGDLPDAPGKSKYDFVLRGAEGAIWVTGQRPKGKGFDLDIERRLDTSAWLSVTGTVKRDRGLVYIEATQLASAKAPDAVAPPEEVEAPAPPPKPIEVVFNSPVDGETDVLPTSTVRIQFSRGLKESTLAGHIKASYVGASPGAAGPEFKTTYDAATRSVQLKFTAPLESFRTVRIDVLEGLQSFDGAPALPWSVTFTTSN